MAQTLVREGTMQVTAQEGIAYLQQQRANTLLEVQGLPSARTDSSKVDSHQTSAQIEREGTMQTTAREGQAFLATNPPQAKTATSSQPSPVDKSVAEKAVDPKASVPAKSTTDIVKPVPSEAKKSKDPKPAVEKPKKPRAAAKKSRPVSEVLAEEAKAFTGAEVSTSSGRSMRKRKTPPPPPEKKARAPSTGAKRGRKSKKELAEAAKKETKDEGAEPKSDNAVASKEDSPKDDIPTTA